MIVSNILDRPLGRGLRSGSSDPAATVSLSSFCLLYSEIIQYHQNRVDSISELERRLECTGFAVGLRVLELIAYRNRDYKREIRLMNVLQWVSTQVWKSLFGKVADSLERSIDHTDEFMIVDYAPITSTFASVPSDFGGLSVDAYLSGIIAGVLEGAGFAARVTAHMIALEEGEAAPPQPLPVGGGVGGGGVGSSSGGGGAASSSSGAAAISAQQNYLLRKEKTVFLVKFAPHVLARNAAMI